MSTRRLKPRLTKIAFGDKSTFADSCRYRFAMNRLVTEVTERNAGQDVSFRKYATLLRTVSHSSAATTSEFSPRSQALE
jgi:hypothetical protein